MTAQLTDPVFYKGKFYSIAGKNGTGLFDPTEYGMKPVSRTSACWRGYHCIYFVADKGLYIYELSISFEDTPPILFGIQPTIKRNELRMFDVVYEKLLEPIQYSGCLLLAPDFIQELYVHMGFHPAWKYKEVHELIFLEGNLVNEIEQSENMAGIREKMKKKKLRPDHGEGIPVIAEWVEKCFNQDYNI